MEEIVRQRLIPVRFDGYLCYVDLETLDIYSSRLKLLKPYWDKNDKMLYYNILYNGRRCKRSQHRLVDLVKDIRGQF